MKWYFTPSIGNYGAAIEIDEEGYANRIAFASLSEAGLAFVKWAPTEDGMCEPKGMLGSGLVLYEAKPEHVTKLNGMWSPIIRPNGTPRLLP